MGLFQEGMVVESKTASALYRVKIPYIVSVIDNGDGVRLDWNRGNGTTIGIHREGAENQVIFFSSSNGMLFPLDDLQPLK